MPSIGSTRAPLAACALALAAVSAAPLPAHAHPHPSGSIDRITPGVVRVESAAKVHITLLDDRARLEQVVREYDVPLGAGSGFNVAPEGVVVTSTGVAAPPGRDPRVYAANRVVAEHFGQEIPADFARHRAGDGDADARLQSCYPPYGSTSTCLVRLTPTARIFPNTEPPTAQGLPATVLRTGRKAADPAVAKVAQGSGNTLPTVPLAARFPTHVTALDTVGLAGRPGARLRPAAQIAHYEKAGGPAIKKEDRAKLAAMLGRGGTGGALVDDAKSEVIGLASGGGGAPLATTSVDDVRPALTAAGATARRGPVDVVYETALAQYHTRRYQNAIPILRQVLRLRPDHAVAAEHLRTATARGGGARDAARNTARPADGSGADWLWPGAGALVVVALAAGGFLLWRRHTPAPAGAGPGGSGPQPRPQPRPAGATRAPDGATVQDGVPAGLAAAPEAPPPERYCTHCGMRVGRAHQFCGFCGHQVEP